MRHPERRHRVQVAGNVDKIVAALFVNVYPLCTGIRWASLVLLNDSDTLVDQIWAVLREGRQIEELTVPLMTPQHLHDELLDLEREGSPNEMGMVLAYGGHPANECALCAPPHDYGGRGAA